MIRFLIFLLWEYFDNFFSKTAPLNTSDRHRSRLEITTKEILVHTHEWAGYPFFRQKLIKYQGTRFDCGLQPVLRLWDQYKGKYFLRKIITVSDMTSEYYESLSLASKQIDTYEIYSVSNKSMDFSGYSFIFNNCLSNENQYVFLTNTSINANSNFRIDQYVKIMEENKNLGLLGASYSSKVYQTFVKNNYIPHVQSFFIVTTSAVLREIVQSMGGSFPGSKYSLKQAIIRFGEVALSQNVLKLGYSIGVVDNMGKLQLLPPDRDGSLVEGDYRLYTTTPNLVNDVQD